MPGMSLEDALNSDAVESMQKEEAWLQGLKAESDVLASLRRH